MKWGHVRQQNFRVMFPAAAGQIGAYQRLKTFCRHAPKVCQNPRPTLLRSFPCYRSDIADVIIVKWREPSIDHLSLAETLGCWRLEARFVSGASERKNELFVISPLTALGRETLQQ